MMEESDVTTYSGEGCLTTSSSDVSDLLAFDPFYYKDEKKDVKSVNSNLELLSNLTLSTNNETCPSSEKQSSSRRRRSDSLSSYIENGRRHICLGRTCEANNAPQAAVAHYKSGIQVLLEGAKDDPEEWRRDAVRIKTIKYLHYVEKLCEKYFPEQIGELKYMDSNCVCANASELHNYKVVGVVGNVCLVQPTTSTTSTQVYVMKVLPRLSGTGVKCLSKHIIPTHIPHMAKLYRYYLKTDNIFLLVQYAEAGKLWSHISSYIEHTGSSNTRVSNLLPLEQTSSRKTPTAVIEEEEDVFTANEVATVSKDPLQQTDATKPKMKSMSEVANHSRSHRHVQHQREKRNHLAVSGLPKSHSEHNIQRMQERGGRNLSGVFQELDLANYERGADARLPESCVRVWVAEIALALNHLHRQGIIWVDLYPDNILLGARGHILLTYESRWDCVQFTWTERAVEGLYVAPEVTQGLSQRPFEVSCDWWSMGVIAYELLCGMSFQSCHSFAINTHFTPHLPSALSREASSFLTELLRYHPNERLGSGTEGFSDIQNHPFFQGVDWKKIHEQAGDITSNSEGT